MTCAVLFALSLATAAPAAGEAPAAVPAVATVSASAPLASEPMYADIVARARLLGLKLEGFKTQAAKGAAGSELAGYDAFKTELAQLAALNMQGHFDLKARNRDGDLKCILKGVAEDLPVRLSDFEAAKTADQRVEMLKEIGYLLNDNVEVITSPPGPKTPTPAG
jgi:hypothetical protein